MHAPLVFGFHEKMAGRAALSATAMPVHEYTPPSAEAWARAATGRVTVGRVPRLFMGTTGHLILPDSAIILPDYQVGN